MGHRNRKRHAAAIRCLNCGEDLAGAYCAACGQSSHEGRGPTLGHFFHDLVHEVLHVDGKLFQTVRVLLFSPGLLSAEYWSGRVSSWIRPIRLFLVVAAIHWFASTGVGPFNLQVLLEREPSGEFSVSITSDPLQVAGKNGRVPATPAESAEFLEKFRHNYAKIRYFSVLLFAFASWLLYRRRQPLFVHHLVSSLHFFAFWYLLAIATSALMAFHPGLGGLGLVVSTPYLGGSLRRLYKESWARTVIKTAVLVAVLGLIELMLGFAAGSWTVREGGLPNARVGEFAPALGGVSRT